MAAIVTSTPAADNPKVLDALPDAIHRNDYRIRNEKASACSTVSGIVATGALSARKWLGTTEFGV